MRTRLTRLALAASLLLPPPGMIGALARAEDGAVHVEYNPQTNTIRRYDVQAAQAPSLSRILQTDRLSPETRRQMEAVNAKYGDYINPQTAPPEVTRALQDLDRSLRAGTADSKAWGSFLSGFYDYGKKVDAQSTLAVNAKRPDGTEIVTVYSRLNGQQIMQQISNKIGYKAYKRVITRRDPRTGQDVIDAVYIDRERGAERQQKILYNRRFVDEIEEIKKFYFDQCGLVRQINNGSLTIKAACADARGTYNPTLTPQAREEMKKALNAKRAHFPAEVLAYLQLMHEAESAKNFDSIDPELLEQIQRKVMRFYNDSQLDTLQKYMLYQLTNYMQLVTNTAAQTDKNGRQMLDPSYKDIDELQKSIEAYNQGKLTGFQWWSFVNLKWLGKTKISEHSARDMDPKVLGLLSEAYADIAYAVQAKRRTMDKTASNQQLDAAIEEGQQWLRLAQAQLQRFGLLTEAISLERMAKGRMPDNLGMDEHDTAMQSRAMKLAAQARDDYMPQLEQAELETKDLLLKQTGSALYLTYVNALAADLYHDTLRDRVRTMAAKARELKAIYLADAFSKVKAGRMGLSAKRMVEGEAYGGFLRHLPPEVAAKAELYDALALRCEDLTKNPSDDEVLAALKGLGPDIERLLGGTPDAGDVQKQAQALGIKQAHIFQEVSDFTAKLGLFDAVNQLDIYINRAAGDKKVSSANESSLSYFFSFDWLGKYYGKVPGVKESADGIMNHGPGFINFVDKVVAWTGLWQRTPYSNVAFQKLGANREIREQVLNALRKGDFNGATALIAKLDPQGFRDARKAYEADRSPEDRFDDLEIDSMFSKARESGSLAAAQNTVYGLFNYLQSYIKAYNIARGVTDLVVDTLATAGVGELLGFGADALSTVSKMSRAERVRELGGLGHAVNALETFGRLPVISYVSRWGTASLRNVIKVADAGRIPERLLQEKDLIGIAKYAGSAYVRRAIPHTLMYTGTSTAIMSFMSGGIQYAMYLGNPAASQFNSGSEAFMTGLAMGTAFGARASTLFLFSPIHTSALGTGRVSNFLRGFADTPGPLSGTLQYAAKVFAPGGPMAEFGPLGKLQMMATDTVAGEMLARSAVYGLGVLDGAAKYMLLGSEIPAGLAQVGYFYYQQIKDRLGHPDKENDPGATHYVTMLAHAQTFADAVAQGAFIFVPTNPMYSVSEMRQFTQSQNAFTHLLRSGRGEEIERSVESDRLTVNKSPWHWRPSDLWRGKTGLDLEVGEQHRKIAVQRRLAKEAKQLRKGGRGRTMLSEAGKEILAGGLLTSDDHGKITSVVEMERSLDGADLRRVDFAKPGDGHQMDLFEVPGDAAERGQRRVTNESIAAYQEMLSRWLRSDADFREKVLDAEGHLEYQGVKVSGERLERLKNMAGSEDIEARSMSAVMPFGRFDDLLAGRRVRTKQDVLTAGVEKGAASRYKSRNREMGISAVESPEFAAQARIGAAQDEMQAEINSVSGVKRSELKAVEERTRPAIREAWQKAQEGLRAAQGQGETAVAEAKAKGIVEIRRAEEARRAAFDALIQEKAGLQAKALKQVRRSVESAAFLRQVSLDVIEAFPSYAKTYKKHAGDLRSGKMTREQYERTTGYQEISKLAQRYIATWEQGVLGPEFKDAHGRAIERFNDMQRLMIAKNIEALAEGDKKLVFDLMSTGGGKTLLGFVTLDFLGTYAQKRGRQGTFYVTTNGELVAQAREAYLAFFKGKKPPFEIVTYFDLMARLAEADSRGTLDPFRTHDMIWDEAEEPGMKTALSLGSPNGGLTYSAVDPVYQALRWGSEEIMSGDRVFSPKDEKANLNEQTVRERVQSPEVDAKFQALVDEVVERIQKARRQAASKDYWDSIDVSMFPGLSKERLRAEVRKQHRNAFGTMRKMGVIDGRHGDVRNWVEKLLEGSYMLRSSKDVSKVYKYDAGRDKVYMIHNDTVYENLDTPIRSAAQLHEDVSLDFDYDTINITDYRRLNTAARDAGAIVVGLSGTLADGIIPFMVDEAGWHIQGKGTILPPVKARVLEGRTAVEEIADAVLRVHQHNTLGHGSKDVVVAYADSVQKADAMTTALEDAGLSRSRVSVAVRPGSNFESEKLLRGDDVRGERNLLALDQGLVDVVLLVGQDGLRGLDLSFAAYKGGILDFYTTDSESLAKVSQAQLFGRTYAKRAEGMEKNYHMLAEAEALKSNSLYQKLVRDTLRSAAADREISSWKELEDAMRNRLRPGQTIENALEDPMLYKERALKTEHDTLLAIKRHVARQMLGQTEAQVEGRIRSQRLGAADAQEVRDAARDRVEGFLDGAEGRQKVDQRLRQLFIDGVADGPEFERFLKDNEVFGTLVWEMQRKAEMEALSASGVTRGQRR